MYEYYTEEKGFSPAVMSGVQFVLPSILIVHDFFWIIHWILSVQRLMQVKR